MATSDNIIQRIRQYILLSFLSLPLLLFTFTLFMGLSLSNIGLLLFAAAQILIFVITMLLQKATNNFDQARLPAADILQLVPSAAITDSSISVTPSYWMAYMAFFLSYIFVNAIYVYKMPQTGALQQIEYENRRSKAVSVAIMTALAIVLFTIIRYSQGLEKIPSSMFTIMIFGLLGWGFYSLSNTLGVRHADVFGIVTQILPKDASGTGGPKTCFYTAQAS